MAISITFNQEYFNEESYEFMTTPLGTYEFEHSLLSLSAFESKYRIPLLDNKDKTPEQLIDYAVMMCTDPSFDPNLLTPDTLEQILGYISETPSATTIKQSGKRGSSYISSESIYASMAMAQVPFSAETWNLNRLMNVLAIIGERSDPKGPKKMSKAEIRKQQQELNQQRRAASKTTG